VIQTHDKTIDIVFRHAFTESQNILKRVQNYSIHPHSTKHKYLLLASLIPSIFSPFSSLAQPTQITTHDPRTLVQHKKHN